MFHTHFDAENKIWSGNDEPPLFNSEISIGQVLLRALTIHGPRVAQINADDDTQITYEEIRCKTIRAAKNLQHLGYRSKQIFGFMAKNSNYLAPTLFASICIGCPVNTLDPSFDTVELMYMLKKIKPILMFCDVDVYNLVEHCLKELDLNITVFTFGGQIGESYPVEVLFTECSDENRFLPVRVDAENDITMIVCSSGTTGLYKGVCLSHASIINAMAEYYLVDSNDVMLSFSSLYWITASFVLFAGTLNGAKRLITKESFTPELQLQLIEKFKVTFLSTSPYHIVLLLKNENIKKTDLSSVKLQLICGTKPPIGLSNEFNKHFDGAKRLIDSYGCSEVGMIASDYPGSDKIGSVGQLVNGVMIKVTNKFGERCPPNVDGEICVKRQKNSLKFLGYFGNQKVTADVFDEEGFFKTGDIGHFDTDGYLFIVDRIKDIMIYCNNLISPSKIESFLNEYPGISSVCVVGIPDEIATDLPAAAIVKLKDSKITEQEIIDAVAKNLRDDYKLRGGVYFVDYLPTTPSGKVLRRKVKRMVIEMFNRSMSKVNIFENVIQLQKSKDKII